MAAMAAAGVERRGISMVRDMDLYTNATRSMFYLIGQDRSNSLWRVLNIDRSRPTELSVVEETYPYTPVDCLEFLQGICDAEESGSLKHCTKCFGIVGFIKFFGTCYMLLITGRSKIGTILGHDIYSVDKREIIPIQAANALPSMPNSGDENRYLRLLNSVNLCEHFFFSYSYNITQPIQKNITEKNTMGCQYESAFVWNKFIVKDFQEQIKSPFWTVPLVNGYFRQVKMSVSKKDFWLTMIARRSHHFAGPRFLKRGVNKFGQVANDVETEQIVFEDTEDMIPSQITSVVQRRGSIPLPWSQETPKFPIKPDILINPDEDYKAAHLHFQDLVARHGTPIVVLNLIKIAEKKPYESSLQLEFARTIDNINEGSSTDNLILYAHMDMKNFSRRGNVLPYLLSVGSATLKKTCLFHGRITPTSESGGEGVVVQQQHGVLRTNCLDCLDRTNSAQYAYALTAFGHQLEALRLIDKPEIAVDDPLSHKLMDLYEQMGDALSMQYTGSAAQHKMFWDIKGKCGAISLSQEIIRSIQRFMNNAFWDRGKQDALNVFLGHCRPQQGMPLPPLICGSEATRNNQEHESGNRITVQGRHLVAGTQNHPRELKYQKAFHSNFMVLDEPPCAGSVRKSRVLVLPVATPTEFCGE